MAEPSPDLIFRRIFAAPRPLVFACLTEPEHLTHFWGPAGTSAPLEDISVDLRPGGVFATVMVSDADGTRMPTHATYVEIEAPARLVWIESHSGMTSIATLRELDDGTTEVEIRQTTPPDAYRHPAAQAGFLSSLDRFSTYLRQLRSA